MGVEIEIKARISNVSEVLDALKKLPYSTYQGEVDKTDIYWSDKADGTPFFRTRAQIVDGKESVLITSKPDKLKVDGTEFNIENEFETDISQWNSILTFCQGLKLVHCRHKYKKGWQFMLKKNSSLIHAELFEVKYIGYFLEMEICGEDFEEAKVEESEKDLHLVLEDLNIPKSAIEPTGYNKLLEASGHILD